MHCALCRAKSHRSPNRIGGLDLCDNCQLGGALEAALARGFELGVSCFSRGGGDKKVYIAEAKARVPGPLFAAKFMRKGGRNLLRSLFGGGLRVDDPLFHEIGRIETDDPHPTSLFMESEGAQSIVMDLLGEDVAITVRADGRVTAMGRRKSEAFDQANIERELAVLLVHLDAFAARRRGAGG